MGEFGNRGISMDTHLQIKILLEENAALKATLGRVKDKNIYFAEVAKHFMNSLRDEDLVVANDMFDECVAIEELLSTTPEVLAVTEATIHGDSFKFQGHQPNLWSVVFAGTDPRFKPVTVVVLASGEED